jgi:dTDP-4-dehydrorhamnose reductase
MVMKIVLFGSRGQLGTRLAGALGCFAEVVGLDHAALDLTRPEEVRARLKAERPHVVVNAAAYTDVDGAERDEATATRVNGDSVGAMGEVCRELRAGLVHFSTDFVFDGRARVPYREDAATAPLGAYGRSKLAGEKALAASDAPAVVLRTAWVYSPRRKSFVASILRLAREREALQVVADQSGNPTFAGDLASAAALIVHGVRADPYGALHEARGIYHLAGGGVATRFELAEATVALDPRRQEHKVTRLEPVPTSAFPLPAARPAFAPLDCAKARARFGVELPPWRDALARALSE